MKDSALERENRIHDRVREGYAALAVGSEKMPRTPGASSGSCGGGSCCGPVMSAEELARRLGYAPEDLEKLPHSANLGLSCGNPTAIAALEPGEVVVDLGSGAGFDCFLAGPKVGPSGRVIGVDMTWEMIRRARESLVDYRDRSGLDNVEFRLGEIEHLPLADASVDVVVSNCVINLSPQKEQVYSEIARVLRPGGRIAVSDIALLRELPEVVSREALHWVGCVAGADLVSTIRDRLERVGFEEVHLEPQEDYVRTMEEMNDPLYSRIRALLPEGDHPHDYLTSLEIRGRRSRSSLPKA